MGCFFLLLFHSATLLAMAESPVSWMAPWQSVPQLVRILREVPEGREVLLKASKKEPRFAERVRLGHASFTESTFSRTYSLLNGQEQISLRHEVTINRDLALADAVVDLAHELVHFAEKGMLDPYRAGFELTQFVRNGIEGEGGELSAIEVECRVAWSLERKFRKFPLHRLCTRYRGKLGAEFLRETARKDYYALGAWMNQIAPELKASLPEVSARAAVFTSSYAGKPYPVALAEEYVMTRQAACANNRRKYQLIASQSNDGRRPASRSLLEERRRLRVYERRYCRSVPADSEE